MSCDEAFAPIKVKKGYKATRQIDYARQLAEYPDPAPVIDAAASFAVEPAAAGLITAGAFTASAVQFLIDTAGVATGTYLVYAQISLSNGDDPILDPITVEVF